MAKNGFEEAQRLKALRGYQILDTPPEPQFEDIAVLAAELCNTPIGSVAFADQHRHWSKANIGLHGRSIPWEHAVCSVVFDGPVDPLIIEDLAEDTRTREMAIVRGEPFMRFYASVALRAPDGTAIGTLCVIDFKPRPGGLTAAQLTGLQALGRQTMALLWWRVAL